MSFKFNWPEFDADFIQKASEELENALNRGKKPSNICDLIHVKELHMGTKPPELDILEIGEVSMDRFRGIFKLAYSGDGYLVLETKVQANPLNFSNYTPSGEPVPESANPSSPFMPSNPTILAADCPLIVPMQLKISLMRLRAIVVLIVSRTTGVTLSFKTDPLESVLVSSTFDSLPSVRRHLQAEIEIRLRDLFQKELPAMVHLLSNEWLKKRGLSKRTEDVRDVFSSPESVSAMFPAPNRTLSPPSVADKNSAPFPKRIKTPKSTSSFQKNPSIAAKSAPAELEAKATEVKAPSKYKYVHEYPDFKNTEGSSLQSPSEIIPEFCGIVTLVPEKVEKIKFPEVFDFVIHGSVYQSHQSCYSEFGASMPVDQYYFKSKRSIIVRAPTDLALPDPVLIDPRTLLKKKSVNVAKIFRSLFKIPEIEEGNEDKSDIGLKAIEGIGTELNDSGSNSVRSLIPDNCSVRSRTRSMLLDPHMNRALSTISGNCLLRYKVRHGQNVHRIISHHNSHNNNYHERFSEADPDLVQFEPDEFRSLDFKLPMPARNDPHSKTLESLDGESKGLAVKFGIMRKLQSTLAPNNFIESNILYRTRSQSKK